MRLSGILFFHCFISLHTVTVDLERVNIYYFANSCFRINDGHEHLVLHSFFHHIALVGSSILFVC